LKGLAGAWSDAPAHLPVYIRQPRTAGHAHRRFHEAPWAAGSPPD